jgi:hypothetical protein
MPAPPFRELYTLTDTVELIGRRLYSDTWTSFEYMYAAPVRVPTEIAAERAPLEEELGTIESQIDAINREIAAILEGQKIERLKKRRRTLETRADGLRAELRQLPLNDIILQTYNSHIRWHQAKDALVDAIRQFRLKVHDGRGHELNHSVWLDPRFRCYIDLSIVVNSKTAGSPRRQAARIDRDAFKNWLASINPLVEPPSAPAVQERLTEYVRREIDVARGVKHKTKSELLESAKKEIPGVTKRMFEHVWASETPAEWRKAGARPKN